MSKNPNNPLNPNRKVPEGVANPRSKSKINRLKMYRTKARRDKNGNELPKRVIQIEEAIEEIQETKPTKKTKVMKKKTTVVASGGVVKTAKTAVVVQNKVEFVPNRLVISTCEHNHERLFAKKGRKIVQKSKFIEGDFEEVKVAKKAAVVNSEIAAREVEVTCPTMFRRDRKTGEIIKKVARKTAKKAVKK